MASEVTTLLVAALLASSPTSKELIGRFAYSKGPGQLSECEKVSADLADQLAQDGHCERGQEPRSLRCFLPKEQKQYMLFRTNPACERDQSAAANAPR